jgi:predicted KAP-like P-loop ATPase
MELTSDSPLKEPSDDRLGRWGFSKRIAEAISSREDSSSLTIGIHGPWGEGKTTVLNFIEHALEEEDDDIISLRFNPWRTGSEEELIVSFFQALAEALGCVQ